MVKSSFSLFNGITRRAQVMLGGCLFLSLNNFAWAENGCNGRTFAAMTLPNNEIVFGGDFTECNGVSFNHIVRYNPVRDRWLPLGTRGRGTNESVYSLTWYQDTLIVGGAFTRAGDKKALGIARWDPRTERWAAFTSSDRAFNGNGATDGSGPVIALEASGNALYVGGQFEQMVDVFTPSRVAVFNGQQWASVGNNLGTVSTLYALKMFQGVLYAGGQFMPDVNQLARFDGNNWQPLAFGVDGSVLRLAVYQNELIAAGRFTRTCVNAPNAPEGCVGAGSILTGNVARWNGSSFNIINPITVSSQLQGSLNSIALSGLYAGPTRLLVGGLISGNFPASANSSFYGLALTRTFNDVWSAPGTVSGSALGGLFGYCNQGAVRTGYAPSFAESGDALYVAGDFAGVGAPVAESGNPLSICPPNQPAGLPARNIARFVESQAKNEWQALNGSADADFLFGDGLEE